MKIIKPQLKSYDYYKSEYFNFNSGIFFIVLTSIYLGLLYYSNICFLTDSVYYNSYSESTATETISKIIGIKNKFIWLSYIIFPLILLFKMAFSIFCIKTRLVFSDINLKWKYILKIVLFSELAFLFQSLAKVILLTFFKKVSILNDVQLYTPFSIYGLIKNPSLIPKYLITLFQMINLFEIFYWFLLSFGLSVFLKIKFIKSVALIFTSYCVGLLFWILFLMFIIISYA